MKGFKLCIIFFISLFPIYGQEYFYQEINDSFYSNVVEQYQEREEIDPYILNTSPEGVFRLNENAEIFTSFLDEGAGYRNTFGLFTVDRGDDGSFIRTTVQKYEIFSNASKIGSGGSMSMGDSYKSAVFEKGTNFGFYINSNGYRNRRSSHTFYSYTPFNIDNVKHTVLTYDYSQDKLAIGFEDLYGGGDKDYNDLIISVFTNPVNELRQSSITEGVANITGQQTLGAATGMVTMSVASFGRMSVSDEIIMYPEEYGKQSNVNFLGKGELYVESNTGVLIRGTVTKLSNGIDEVLVDLMINGQRGDFYTPAGQRHNDIHEVSVDTFIENISTIESGDFVGYLTLTMSIY
jgi:hypothetical protein